MLRFDSPKNDKARTLDLDASTVGALHQLRERQVAEDVADVGLLVFRRPTRLGFQPWRPDVTTHNARLPAAGRRGERAGDPALPAARVRIVAPPAPASTSLQ